MQKREVVRMSDFLTVEDFEGMKLSHHNMSPFEILLQVAAVAAKKLGLVSDDKGNAEPDLGSHGVSGKRDQMLMEDKILKKPMKKLRSVMRKRRNGEQKFMSFAINNDVKTDFDEGLSHGNLIIGRQRVQNTAIDESSRKPDKQKRKLDDTISNREWIEAMERKKKSKRDIPHPLSPSLPEEFERQIKQNGGTGIIRVIQKCLYKTDVSRSHSRISIPCCQVESYEFLEDSEITLLRQRQSITVPLIHRPKENGVPLPLTETSMEFGQWNLHKANPQYLLKTNWNTIVSEDELKQGDIIQIWAFRNAQRRLCMALIKLRE